MVAAGTARAGATYALVTTEWLEKNLKDPKVRIIEVSVNPGVFGGLYAGWRMRRALARPSA